MLEELIEVCRIRKKEFLELRETRDIFDPDLCYARGVYFGMLAALKVANNGVEIRV